MDNIIVTFSSGELDAIVDALNYLLGAELLPEYGYTDEVVATYKSALSKVQKAKSNEVD